MKTRDLRFTLDIKAKPEAVYRALTSARELCRWWLSGAETDARSSGRIRMVWPKAPRNGVLPRGIGEREGFFVDLEPGRKVAWIWKPSARHKAEPALNSFFIHPKRRGCEVTLLHSGFPVKGSDRAYEGYAKGWEDCLAKLKLYLETGRAMKTETITLAQLKDLIKEQR